MFSKGLFRLLIGYLFTIWLSVLVSGCGGDSNDGSGSSLTAKIFLNARTGPILGVRVDETAILDGSRSTNPSKAPLGYSWSFSSKPDSSNAVLQNPTTASPSFVADVRGAYMVQLVVSAEGISSQRAIQLVVATIDPERPTGPFSHLGLSSSCINCHSGELDLDSRPGKIPGKSPNHLASGNSCEACHTPMGFTTSSPSLDESGNPVILPSGLPVGSFTVSAVDHQQVFGNCSSCHDGALAVGKSELHIATSVECDNCHNTNSFFELALDGSFDHTGVSTGCSSCHDGIVAIGKTDIPIHENTESDCIFCHLAYSPPTTIDFQGGYPDHTSSAVLAVSCDSCHGNGSSSSAQGEPDGHPVMDTDCGSCHGVVTFSLGGVFNHRIDATVQDCQTCHTEPNSINAPGTTPEHPATSGADCGVCHSTESFADAFDHTAIVNNCQTCHGNNSPVGGQVTATGKPPTTALYEHMPTNPNNPGTASDQDCGDCHSTGTFKTGTYDHAGIVSGCESCHDNKISIGKLAGHFPTPGASVCADCHYDAVSTPTVFFVGASFDHVGIAGNDCASCHSGTFTTSSATLYGKSPTHIPTSQDCSVCHATGVPFKPASNFNHVGITDQCEDCHNGNSNFVAVGAIGKTVSHIPANGECSECHNSTATGGFTSSTFTHSGITRGCEGCHTSPFLPLPTNSLAKMIKQATHLPTNQDCYRCHTTSTEFINNITPLPHTNITGNCSSCHDGSTDNVEAGAIGTTPDHIVTTEDCGACHTTASPLSFESAFVDHTGPDVIGKRCDSCHNGTIATGITVPPHVATTEDCNVCHVAGATFVPAVFNHTGIVDNCASCHNGTDAIGMTAPPHIPTADDCSLCHNTTAFAGAKYDHSLITGSCTSCHNGTTAPGKTTNHVPTLEDCGVCHVTTGFLPASFSHQGIVDNCSSCHDTGLAKPKSLTHVTTGQDCGVCHNTTAFIPATIDHSGPDVVGNRCDSCHNGEIATGLIDATPPHIATSLDCSSCHTTATFAGGSWIHDSAAANNCDSCHSSGGGATPKSSGHLSTNEQCDVCHTTNGWGPTSFSHSSEGNYPGDHRSNLGCTSCHKGSIGGGINSSNYPDKLTYAPFCAGCHAGDFEREGDHIGGKNGTIAQNKDCSGGGRGCHKVSDKDFD